MAILPIDIQTVIGQMDNVGKVQHKVDHASTTQQQLAGNVIHKQTDQQTHDVTQLQHSDNQDKIIHPDKEKRESQTSQHKASKKNLQKKEDADSAVFFNDPDKGTIIDIKK